MRNVGVSAVSTAWLLASANEPAALAVADLVAKAGRTRVAFEEREGAHLASADANQSAARLREDQIVTAWKQWYAEAVASASRLVVGQTSPAFRPKTRATGEAVQRRRDATGGARWLSSRARFVHVHT